MQEIKRSTLELILKSFEASSSDDIRLNLNTVRLGHNTKGDMIVESTNGHILARHFVVNEDELELTEDILIHRDGKSKLKNFLNTNKDDRLFQIDTNIKENENLRIFTKSNRDGIVLPVVFRDYPKTDAVIPKKNDDYIEVMFNPDLLTKLYKSMNGDKRNSKVKLLINTKNTYSSPILVESGKNNLGVLMPLKG